VITLIPVGQRRQHVIEGLTPSTTYVIRIRTCINSSSVNSTDDQRNETINCNVGSASSGTTPIAPPSGQAAPKLKALNSRSVKITWNAPESPNGIITGYRVLRRLEVEPGYAPGFEELVFVSETPNDRFYIDSSSQLRPYTKYQYQVTTRTLEICKSAK